MTDPLDWERPNPPHLNSTSAIVRKGTYPYTLKTGAGCMDSCDMPFVPENTFNRKGLPMMGACGPYGAGGVIVMRGAKAQNGGRTADGNGTVPGNRGSLSGGIEEVHRSGPPHPSVGDSLKKP